MQRRANEACTCRHRSEETLEPPDYWRSPFNCFTLALIYSGLVRLTPGKTKCIMEAYS